MNIKKDIIIVTLAQLFSWIIFSVVDCIIEHLQIDCIVQYIIALALPILLSIIYLKSKKIDTNCSLKCLSIRMVIWILETVIIGSIICNLVNNNSWIIYQRRNLLLDLNGLEYFIFAFLLGIIPVLVIIIYNIVISIYKKIKNQKINKKIYKTNKGEINNG